MSQKSTLSLRDKLFRAGIKDHDVLIHDQSKEWLQKEFAQGSDEYPVNVSALMRNIIWQTRKRIQEGSREPLTELLRTFWYMYIKPTLSRAEALSRETDQYDQLIDQMVFMVKDLELMRYKDIGFRDDNEVNRRVGQNANIILFSEKIGHQGFLAEMASLYNISTLALGGQPSVLNSEYFVDDLKARGVSLKKSFYLFSIVDYDPSGWIIRDAFVNNLNFYGIHNIEVFDLVTPDMLTADELLLSRYLFPDSPAMTLKNQNWLKEVGERHYQNQHLLVENVVTPPKQKLYGLESESISSKRLHAQLEKSMVPLLGKDENYLKHFALQELNTSLKNLILQKIA